MRAHHERARQRASFNAWVCALTSHASFFQFQFQYLSANSPALVQWRFVCICVCVCVFVCLSALPTRLLLTPTPPTLWIMRSNHAHYQPYTLFVPSSFIHSFLYSLSLYRLFGWSNVQVTFDNYY